jgi:(p)ppGpp synthase/HD superfamily hydrolase
LTIGGLGWRSRQVASWPLAVSALRNREDVQMRTAPTDYPEAFASAVGYAARAHATQYRKRAPGEDRPQIPYLSHLLAVAGLVIEDLGSQDDAIAGLLHDVLEDQDAYGTRGAEIERLFGADVLEIVESCSGPKKEDPGMADFRVRKQVYLDHLRDARKVSSIRVSLADKVHNARCTVNDLEAEGPQMWRRFNAGAADQLWWYGNLAETYADHAHDGRADTARAAELGRLVARMRELTPTLS